MPAYYQIRSPLSQVTDEHMDSYIAAVSAAVTAFLFVKEKQRKDDEELMEYLDSAIE